MRFSSSSSSASTARLRLRLLCARPFLRARARDQQRAAEDHEGDRRQPGHEPEAEHHDTGHADRALGAEDLLGHLVGEVVLGRGLRRQDAGGDRDHEARDLADETVTDRQDRVLRHRVSRVHVAHQRADQDAADDVDRGDHDARDGVAADELAGTVHGAVELGLARDLGAAAAWPPRC